MKASQPASLPTGATLDLGKRTQRASLAVIGFVVLGLTLGALGHVAVYAKLTQVELSLGEANKTHGELLTQRRNLEIEIGMLKNPERMIAIARDKLLMRPAAPEDIRMIGANRGKGTR
jgi:cell division protein FtsL